MGLRWGHFPYLVPPLNKLVQLVDLRLCTSHQRLAPTKPFLRVWPSSSSLRSRTSRRCAAGLDWPAADGCSREARKTAQAPERRLASADSTDQRNASAKAFCGCLETERLPGPFVQSTSNRIELGLMNIRQIHPLREVLAQQTVLACLMRASITVSVSLRATFTSMR